MNMHQKNEVLVNDADEIEKLRRRVSELQQQRDTVRRTFCFIIASGNFNARDGNTAHRVGAEWVAELNGWDCFKETA